MNQDHDRIVYKTVATNNGPRSAHIWGPEFAKERGPADHSPGNTSDENLGDLSSSKGASVQNRSDSSLLDGATMTSSLECDVTDATGAQELDTVKHKQIPRQQWGKERDFLMAAIGNAVGLGNLWRFPYLCYSSGGGAFLIPYFIMLAVCGIPLLYMELAVGQYTHQGPVGAMQRISPFFQGAGMGAVMLSFLLCTYYNVILAWALYYLGASFQNPLPWSNCNNSWNTDACWDDYSENASKYKPNDTVSPSQEFYEEQVLKQSDGIEDFGSIVWELALLLLLAWVIVYLCLFKGIKSTGKVVYFTATFPYVVIVLLIIRGCTLPGAATGIEFYIRPEWELLKDPTVWVNAAAQNFNSIGIAFGSMIAFASYNKQETKIFRNTLIICLLNAFTSVLCGFAVFSILGNIAYNQHADVEDVVTDGPGLVFIVYPEAFVTMPVGVAQLFSILFFFMLICLAIDSQFASVEVVITTLMDHFGGPLMRILKRKEILVLVVCILAYFCGFPNIFNGGIYFFEIIDYYSSGISLMVIAFFEVGAIAWVYGAKRLASNVLEMTGSPVNIYSLVCWYALAPFLILVIMLFNWIQYTPVTYGDYVFPKWAEGIGWCLACLSLVCLPIGMVIGVKQSRGDTFWKRVVNSWKTTLTSNYDLDEDDDTTMENDEKYTPSDMAIYKVSPPSYKDAFSNGDNEAFPMETKEPIV